MVWDYDPFLFASMEAGDSDARCIGLSDLSHLRLAGIEPATIGLKANLG